MIVILLFLVFNILFKENYSLLKRNKTGLHIQILMINFIAILTCFAKLRTRSMRNISVTMINKTMSIHETVRSTKLYEIGLSK